MIGTIAVLLLAEIANHVCTSSEPAAPQPTQRVETKLVEAINSVDPARSVEDALQMAASQNDYVGIGEAHFNLARLEFEASNYWPQRQLRAAEAACARAACGPELVNALFKWAEAVGSTSGNGKIAVEEAFSVARNESHRPIAMANVLWAAAQTLDTSNGNPILAASTRNIVLNILNREVARAVAVRDSLAEARARMAIATLSHPAWGKYTKAEAERASEEYSRAAAAYAGAGCRPEAVTMLTALASVLDSANLEVSPTLDSALAMAVNETMRSDEADTALSLYPGWVRAPQLSQKRYLSVRSTLINRTGQARRAKTESLALDAERLGDWKLAEKLYLQLLRSASNDSEKSAPLSSLARVCEKQGKTQEANNYRRQVPNANTRPQMSFEMMAVKAPQTQPRRAPWDPPEKPGTEGGTPGVRR